MVKEVTVSIDPGKDTAGVALFDDGRLAVCSVCRFRRGNKVSQLKGIGSKLAGMINDWLAEDHRKDANVVLAIEGMEMRKDKLEAVPRIIELSVMSGVVWGLVDFDRGVEVSPGKWTHGRPKAVNHQILREVLDDEESEALQTGLDACPGYKQKEVLDAVGIGLYVLHRWQ